MIDIMKNRRTIRKYTEQDIPEELLNELLEVAVRASNTGNMQLYSVVVTRDQSNKEKLAPAHFNQPMITTAPVVLTFCADANRFVKWAEQRKAEAGFDNLQTFIASTIDPARGPRDEKAWPSHDGHPRRDHALLRHHAPDAL